MSINRQLDEERDTNRIEAFSDGVIAIAITLLVLEIRVPHIEEGDVTSLFGALLNQWPSYLSYIMSFIIIGIIWTNHHNMFKYIKRADHFLLLLNTLLLLLVAFIPFPTALLGEYIHREGERTAAVVYSATLTATAVMFNIIWWYVTHHPHLLDQTADPLVIRAITRRYFVGPFFYLLSLCFAFFSVAASLSIYALLALLYVLPSSNGSIMPDWSRLFGNRLTPSSSADAKES